MIFFKSGKKVLCGMFLGAITLVFSPAHYVDADEINDRLADCVKIEDNSMRLQCFDELAGKKSPKPDATGTAMINRPVDKEASSATKKLSMMEKNWDLNPDNRKHAFILTPYRVNYFLPVAYNSSPNEDTDLEYDSRAKAQHNEAKFQISFKAKMWEDVLQKPLQGFYDSVKVIQGMDVWLAYTQLSFWQLYNDAFSSPFRDTNYEPELLINLRTDYDILGFKGRFVNVGFNHQSNGRSRPLSRSWNRIVANIGLERNNFGLQLKTWYRLPEDEDDDDNSDISQYMGYGELWATLFWKKQRMAVMLRNNVRVHNNRGAVQLDWSVPLSVLHEKLTDKFCLYVQYFNGYGEGLMDYNKYTNRISAGFMIAEWN